MQNDASRHSFKTTCAFASEGSVSKDSNSHSKNACSTIPFNATSAKGGHRLRPPTLRRNVTAGCKSHSQCAYKRNASLMMLSGTFHIALARFVHDLATRAARALSNERSLNAVFKSCLCARRFSSVPMCRNQQKQKTTPSMPITRCIQRELACAPRAQGHARNDKRCSAHGQCKYTRPN